MRVSELSEILCATRLANTSRLSASWARSWARTWLRARAKEEADSSSMPIMRPVRSRRGRFVVVEEAVEEVGGAGGGAMAEAPAS